MTQLGEVAPCCSPLAVMCGIDRRLQYLACKVKALVILPTFTGGLENRIAEVQASSSVLQKGEWLLHTQTVFMPVPGHHFVLYF